MACRNPMQRSSPVLDTSAEDGRQPLPLLDRAAARLSGNFRPMGLPAEFLGTALGLLLIGLLGWCNWRLARGFDFQFLFLMVSAVTAWIAGRAGAWSCTLASVFVLYPTENELGNTGRSNWVFCFETLLRLAGFGVMTWLAAEAGRLSR